MTFPLPAKPSIAVLPFDNMSGNPEQEYIGDGISENIISALAISPDMLVIARNSTFIYKGKPVKVQQIAEDLGVRYVLEGSFLMAGNRIRITAQLVDALSGHHIWTDQYDRGMQDFFELLDEITRKIAIELQTELTSGNLMRTISETRNFKAWGNNVKGMIFEVSSINYKHGWAWKYFETAIKLDPDFAGAIALLATTYWQALAFRWSKSPLEDLKRCKELIQQAKELDENLSHIYTASAFLWLINKDYEKSIEEAKRAITLGPNDPFNYNTLAYVEYNNGNFKEAASLCDKAERLSPYRPTALLIVTGLSYRGAGKYKEALAVFYDLLDRAKKGGFNILLAQHYLTCTYALQGSISKAHLHAAELFKIDPSYSLEYIRTTTYFKNPEHLEAIVDALRKVGISDAPSEKAPQ